MRAAILQKVLPQSGLSPIIYGLLALGGLGFATRIGLALLSSGTNDIIHWYKFASLVDQLGVRYLYEHVQGFNHPP